MILYFFLLWIAAIVTIMTVTVIIASEPEKNSSRILYSNEKSNNSTVGFRHSTGFGPCWILNF